MRRHLAAILGALAVAASAAGPPTTASDVIALESDGALELVGERRVIVDGVVGDLYVVASPEEHVQFRSHRREDPEAPLEVEVWSDGTSLGFRSADGAERTPRLLWIAVPPYVSVKLEADRCRLVLSGLDHDVEIAGSGNTIKGEKLLGRTQVTGSDTELRLQDVDGDVNLRLDGGTATLSDLHGFVGGVLEGVTLKGRKVEAEWDLDISSGAVELAELDGGGELRVRGAMVELTDSAGSYRIDTDSEIRLLRNTAMLDVRVEGGFVRGTDNEGDLTVTAWESTVNLANIRGPLRVDGEFLDVTVTGTSVPVELRVRDGAIKVEGATDDVRVHHERGEVQVKESRALVEIESDDGVVRVSAARGPVLIEANGESVDVQWAQWPKETDSSISNGAGDVTVRVPRAAGFRLSAESGYGRIDADFDGVHVSDDARRAQGQVNRRNRPMLTLSAEGDVVVRAGGGS